MTTTTADIVRLLGWDPDHTVPPCPGAPRVPPPDTIRPIAPPPTITPLPRWKPTQEPVTLPFPEKVFTIPPEATGFAVYNLIIGDAPLILFTPGAFSQLPPGYAFVLTSPIIDRPALELWRQRNARFFWRGEQIWP